MHVHVHDIFHWIQYFHDLSCLTLCVCTTDLDLSTTPMHCNTYVIQPCTITLLAPSSVARALLYCDLTGYLEVVDFLT